MQSLVSQIGNASRGGAVMPNRVNGEAITKKEEILLRESENEFKRRGHFNLIFPASGSHHYK